MLKLIAILALVLGLYSAAALFLPGILSHRRAKRHVESKQLKSRN